MLQAGQTLDLSTPADGRLNQHRPSSHALSGSEMKNHHVILPHARVSSLSNQRALTPILRQMLARQKNSSLKCK
jgi:hypothetical protein